MRFTTFLPLIALLFFTGCTSKQIIQTRTQFAVESKERLADNNAGLVTFATHYLAQAELAELNRKKAALANAASLAADKNEVAQAYIRYYASLDAFRDKITRERLVLSSLAANGNALGDGFLILNDMADMEASIGTETARFALAEGLRTADAAWKAYQARPVPLPDGTAVTVQPAPSPDSPGDAPAPVPPVNTNPPGQTFIPGIGWVSLP